MNRRNKMISIFILVLAMVVISVINNPLMRTQRAIHRNLLSLTPIGTSMEEVLYIAEGNRGWTIRYVFEDRGVLRHHVRYAYSNSNPPFPEIIGEQSMRIHLGTYHAIFRVDVTAHYVFDENGELFDIFVRKHIDVL